METPVKKPSRIKKFFRWTLFTLAALVTLGALFFAEEDWRGSRAWSNYKRAMEAKGVNFDTARLIPPSVPDDKNLAMIPFFTKSEAIHLPDQGLNFPRRPAWHYGLASDLTIWAQGYGSPTLDPVQAATNILTALNMREAWLGELQSASKRAYCSFHIDYENWSNNTNARTATIGQFVSIKWFFRVLMLRAEAELASSQPSQAAEDIQLMMRVNEGLRDEPLLISQLVGYATAEILLQPIAQGLAEHRWTDDQLKILEERLQQIDLLASTQHSLEGERIFCVNKFFDENGFKPRGWGRMEQLHFNEAMQDAVLPRIDIRSRQIDPSLSRSCDLAVTNLAPHAYLHHRAIAAMTLPSYGGVCLKTATTQTDVDEVMVACALERYRLAEGQYPESLDALIPRFAATLPHDIINGQPLHYRRTSDGKFVLYSVGWNGTDNGGKIALNKDGNLDRNSGDWVFEFPN